MMAVATVENSALEKILNFVNDTGYKELMQNSAKYNVRIRKDRIYRQPYIDGQTGVAQRHCHLFVSDKHRMPGILQGQVYTYPARRWKSQRRSYLGSLMQAAKADPDEHTITTVENPAAIVAAVEEPVHQPEKVVVGPLEQWATFYEEGPFEDELDDEFESEEDFDDETYNRKGSKRKKAAVGRKPKAAGGIPKKATKKKTSENNAQRGSKKKSAPKTPSKTPKNAKKDDDDPNNKPYGCERRRSCSVGQANAGSTMPAAVATPNDAVVDKGVGKKKVSASPYCDFCLGDSAENKKTGVPENLVSCADCGRSGHPTCLQFTSNMMKSVVKYRWQCIECKTCTLCGTSENDDQLLFCDDCDRGYHLYCLDPPLSEPPEGEWSCYLCLQEFHTN
ncbi:zinc finger protein ubi-d4-like isoform X3 [Homarus americanus]|uniref:zinc finger protein ubi-d4-like isoform X3 n=1 Tax=Homarus americanus TaxID=6706 RepID=UPI001C45EB3D|nr:zinc finger protein ubi-d4-like isoform X3 [Homarus americanus]